MLNSKMLSVYNPSLRTLKAVPVRGLFELQGTDCKAGAKTDSRDEGGPQSGGRGLTQIQSLHYESIILELSNG